MVSQLSTRQRVIWIGFYVLWFLSAISLEQWHLFLLPFTAFDKSIWIVPVSSNFACISIRSNCVDSLLSLRKTVKSFVVATTMPVKRCERFAQAIFLSLFNCFICECLGSELRYFRLLCFLSFIPHSMHFTSLFHCRSCLIGSTKGTSFANACTIFEKLYLRWQTIECFALIRELLSKQLPLAMLGIALRQSLTNYYSQ